MVLQSGDKVYLIHTGQWASVVRLVGNDLAMIKIPGDPDEFPVHFDDLALSPPLKKGTDKRDLPGKNNPEKGSFEGLNAGLFIAVSVDPGPLENRKSYLFIVNDSAKSVQFESVLDLPRIANKRIEGEIEPFTWQSLFELTLDALNDHPAFVLKCWSRDGLRQVAHPDFHTRIKAKSVITHQEVNGYLPFDAHLIPVPVSASPYAVIPIKTKRQPQPGFGMHRLDHIPAPEEKAAFETILDLHAEKIFNDPSKYTESEIFQRQLLTFDRYLEMAIRIGVPRVYVIHGVGKGKLKDSILDRCQNNEYIEKAINAYHPLFGFGATEICFEKSK